MAVAGCGASLKAFMDHSLGPFLVSEADHKNECSVGFRHDRSMPEPQAAGDALQGV
jgi:hypothetical protein